MLNLIKLENRIVLDGAAIGEAADHADAMETHADTDAQAHDTPEADDHSDQVAAAAALLADAPAASAPVNVVLIADSLPDYQTLVDAADPDALVIVYDTDGKTADDVIKDAIAQAEAESGNTEVKIESVTILSHGGAGYFNLGNQMITAESLAEQSETLTALSDAMKNDGHIYVYGCSVANGSEIGQQLLDDLAAATHSEVFASNDVTGGDGDWDLEAKSTGSNSDATPPLNLDMLSGYDGNLTTSIPLAISTLEDNPGSYRIFIYGPTENAGSQNPGSVVISNWNPSTFTNVDISYDGWITDQPREIDGQMVTQYHRWTVDYDPVKDINQTIIGGTSGITFTVNDGTNPPVNPAPYTITTNVTLIPVNDAPEFVIGPDITIREDSPPQTFNNYATGIRPGPVTATDEIGQTVNFTVIGNSNPALFSVAPTLTSNGTLTFTAAPDAFGTADITVVLADNGGTQYGGENTSAPQTFRITVTPVPDIIAPTDVTPYVENAAPTVVDPLFDFVNEDPTQIMSGARIQITQNYQNIQVLNPGNPDSYTPYAGQDMVRFTNTANISGTFYQNDTVVNGELIQGGTLVLTGNATAQEYRQAIRSVSFEHVGGHIDGDDPLENRRTVSFQVTDVSGNDSNVVTTDVFVDAINDNPDLTTTLTPLTYTEGDPATRIDPNISLFDVDDAVMTGATVQITGGTYVNGEDILGFNNFGGITGQWSAASGTLVLSGTATKEQYEAALSNVTYRNTNDLNPAEHDRQVTFTVFDNNSRGVGNGPGGDALPGSDSAIRMIDIITENDPPEVDLDENNDGGDPNDGIPGISPDFETTYTENGPAVTIGDIDAIVTDPDSDFLGCNSSGVGMTATITPETFHLGDTLTVDVSGTPINANYNAQTGVLTLTGQATTAQYTQVLRTIRFEINDNPSTGNDEANNPDITPRVVRVQAFDDQCAASDVVISTINVLPVNDPPVLDLDSSDAPPEIDYETTFVGDPVHLTNIPGAPGTITDVDDTHITRVVVTIDANTRLTGDTLNFTTQGTNITGTYNNGVLTLTGLDTKANYQQVLNTITYDYDTTTTGIPDGFQVQVHFQAFDNGDNTGIIESSDIATAFINIRTLAIVEPDQTEFIENCDPIPIAADSSITGDPSSMINSLVVTITNFQSGDVLAASVAGTNIQQSYVNGVLTLNGADTVANYQRVLQSITYQNTSDDPDESIRNITYTLSGTDGRVANAASTSTVVAVNDAPVNHFPNQVATSVNTAVLIDGLSISDIDAREGTISAVLSSAESGTLEITAVDSGAIIQGNGTDTVQLTGTVTQVNAALLGVRYTPFNGFIGNDTITITTNDGGNTGISPNGVTLVNGRCELVDGARDLPSDLTTIDQFTLSVTRGDSETPVTPPDTPDVPFDGITRPDATGMGGIELGAIPLPGAVGITSGLGNPLFAARSGPEFFDFCSIEEALRPHLGCRFANTTNLDAKFSSVEWADLGQPRPYLDEEYDLYSRLFIREPGDPGFNLEALTLQQDLGGLPDQAPAVFQESAEPDFNDMRPGELKQAFFANRPHLDKTGR